MFPSLMFSLYAATVPNDDRAAIARQTRVIYAQIRATRRRVGR
jgi:hypothetical protein